MRRLPIYFLLDVSESMVGENHQKLESGLQQITRMLRQDPYALETVYISVIGFAGQVKTIVPLIELASFYPPKLPIGGGTCLGKALQFLMDELDRTLVKTTVDRKGDWRPIVFLITDGKPTDAVAGEISQWKASFANRVTLVAVALGKFADIGILKQLTEHTFILENSNDEHFKTFIDWVSASVAAQSQQINDKQQVMLSLSKANTQALSFIKDVSGLQPLDPDYVIILGRCQKTRAPYLMRYERVHQQLKISEYSMDTSYFTVAGCFPIEESYFEWAGASHADLSINSEMLLGAPGCPHCGNDTAFAMCSCGGIFCIDGDGMATCPWCRSASYFSLGNESFDVNRSYG